MLYLWSHLHICRMVLTQAALKVTFLLPHLDLYYLNGSVFLGCAPVITRLS